MNLPLTELRQIMNQFYRFEEAECDAILLKAAELSPNTLKNIQSRAAKFIEAIRVKRIAKGGMDAFLKEYDLSGEEGIALMCLAEAMLRIPDKATVDKLIADKIAPANWSEHAGKSNSLFVNAATWGLIFSGKVLNPPHAEATLNGAVKSLMQKMTAPMVRVAIGQAIKNLGEQFVMGQTIVEAQKRAESLEKMGYLFSYDMLGEAARTAQDAERYMQSYLDAIEMIGKKASHNLIRSSGISIKLSALYPRYEFSHRKKAIEILVPKLKLLTRKAKQYNIGLTVDAEEADRLDLSLDIIEQVFCDSEFAGWEGFGLAVQSYQKRAYYLIDWLAALAKSQHKKIFIRLIKGAYWDSEIKMSQVGGFEGYPVFTRKVATDVSFLACVKKILDYPEAFYPQFATHNAFSVAAVLELAGERDDFEFQCLHGMGYTLYDEVLKQTAKNIPCRVYAPVGGHEDLLAYLVRRLLENGANSSFVNQILNESISVHQLTMDPVLQLINSKPKANPAIPLPALLYGTDRLNSKGIDFSNVIELQEVQAGYEQASKKKYQAKSTLAQESELNSPQTVVGPAGPTQVGTVMSAKESYFENAIWRSVRAFATWSQQSIEHRAQCLLKAADLMEQKKYELMWLATFEAGKTLGDANAEVREAIDFCRYYAKMATQTLSPISLAGPTGETNTLLMEGRGPIVCISPWNFPLAIFLGQVCASLVAGNTVLAKASAQTTLIAARAVEILHEAGIPLEVCQLVIASGTTIDQKFIQNEQIKGVIFTGSTATAQQINRSLAHRAGPIVPLIAETGGQNAMIVDSSALTEQVVQDVIVSAFGSAGQRCSALRVLFIQEEVAEKTIHMLKGAIAELTMGDPSQLATDVGPVIDENALNTLLAHKHYLESLPSVKKIAEVQRGNFEKGTFFAPCAYELPNMQILTKEVFGPVLHVIRFEANALDGVIEQINSTGYGLTLGIQTRIEHTVEYIASRVNVGNVYVNRNMIGAVVGVQPFGGEGLSGTGPKAGGPHYLLRLCTEKTITVNTTAAGGNASLMAMASSDAAG